MLLHPVLITYSITSACMFHIDSVKFYIPMTILRALESCSSVTPSVGTSPPHAGLHRRHRAARRRREGRPPASRGRAAVHRRSASQGQIPQAGAGADDQRRTQRSSHADGAEEADACRWVPPPLRATVGGLDLRAAALITDFSSLIR